MGARKKLAANARKEALKTQYFASLRNVPSSPRKMRYVVDMVRGMEVNRALATLRFSKKAAWMLKNFFAVQSLTGSRRTTARQRMANCLSPRFLLTKA